MSKYIPAEKLKANLRRQKHELELSIQSQGDFGQSCQIIAYENILALIESLQQEQPKFNVGDLVVSKKNPHLTYKILATNIPNELGKTDYKVEIFTDGKPGLLDKPHNIHLISSDKIEDWGELVQQEQPSLPSNLDEAAKEYMRNYIPFDQCDSRDIIHTFKAGAKWMAGQYEKIEGELVDWYSTSDGKDYCCGVKTQDAFEVPEGFYIRKK